MSIRPDLLTDHSRQYSDDSNNLIERNHNKKLNLVSVCESWLTLQTVFTCGDTLENLHSETRRTRPAARRTQPRTGTEMWRSRGEAAVIRPRMGREVRPVRRRLRQETFTETLTWLLPELLTERLESRLERSRRGYSDILQHTPVLKLTRRARNDVMRYGSTDTETITIITKKEFRWKSVSHQVSR